MASSILGIESLGAVGTSCGYMDPQGWGPEFFMSILLFSQVHCKCMVSGAWSHYWCHLTPKRLQSISCWSQKSSPEPLLLRPSKMDFYCSNTAFKTLQLSKAHIQNFKECRTLFEAMISLYHFHFCHVRKKKKNLDLQSQVSKTLGKTLIYSFAWLIFTEQLPQGRHKGSNDEPCLLGIYSLVCFSP